MGLRRIIFNLLSRLVDHDSEVFALIPIFRSPDRSQQKFMFDTSSCIFHQGPQGLEFLWG
jgi:hypothetical protein